MTEMWGTNDITSVQELSHTLVKEKHFDSFEIMPDGDVVFLCQGETFIFSRFGQSFYLPVQRFSEHISSVARSIKDWPTIDTLKIRHPTEWRSLVHSDTQSPNNMIVEYLAKNRMSVERLSKNTGVDLTVLQKILNREPEEANLLVSAIETLLKKKVIVSTILLRDILRRLKKIGGQ